MMLMCQSYFKIIKFFVVKTFTESTKLKVHVVAYILYFFTVENLMFFCYFYKFKYSE